MNLGAHMSIAGGHAEAVRRAVDAGATALQIFTRNQRQWKSPPLADDAVDGFLSARREAGIEHAISHASYLLNLASEKPELYEKSVDGLTIELERAEALGLSAVVIHPGSAKPDDREEGLTRIAEGVREAVRRTDSARCRVAFETTAGAGNQLGARFEDLARLLATSGPLERLGVCLDTCHMFAAGYDLRTTSAYRQTRRTFDTIVGLDHVVAVHVNDSKGELGSHLDRHEHIGEGEIGEEGFRALMKDKKLRDVPKILETPKGDDPDGPGNLDLVNLATLRRLRDE